MPARHSCSETQGYRRQRVTLAKSRSESQEQVNNGTHLRQADIPRRIVSG